MRAKLILPAIAAGLVVLAGCDIEDLGGNFERYHEDFHYNYPLKSGGRLAVDGFNGSVEVSVWDQETVDISGTKYARSQEETADLKIEIDHSADSVAIRAIRPSMRRGNYGAKFAIKVPRGVVLDHLTTSNGAIRTSDGVGPARLKTSNGHVEVRHLKGALNAETSNGPVELHGHRRRGGSSHVERAHPRGGHPRSAGGHHVQQQHSCHAGKGGWRGARAEFQRRHRSHAASNTQSAVRAHTSNNGITLHLPGEVNARLSAATSNASISSDFEMRMRGEISKHHIEGTLGNGGPLIDLSTSNGQIRILK